MIDLDAFRASIERDANREFVHYAQKDRVVLMGHIDAQAATIAGLVRVLRGLVFCVDGAEWDCTASSANGRLDDARYLARAALAAVEGK